MKPHQEEEKNDGPSEQEPQEAQTKMRKEKSIEDTTGADEKSTEVRSTRKQPT